MTSPLSADETAQPFQNHAALAALIEDLGWTVQNVSLAKWDRFLEALNGALIEAKLAERERCSNIVNSFGTNDRGITEMLQSMLDRIAFPEAKL